MRLHCITVLYWTMLQWDTTISHNTPLYRDYTAYDIAVTIVEYRLNLKPIKDKVVQ